MGYRGSVGVRVSVGVRIRVEVGIRVRVSVVVSVRGIGLGLELWSVRVRVRLELEAGLELGLVKKPPMNPRVQPPPLPNVTSTRGAGSSLHPSNRIRVRVLRVRVK